MGFLFIFSFFLFLFFRFSGPRDYPAFSLFSAFFPFSSFFFEFLILFKITSLFPFFVFFSSNLEFFLKLISFQKYTVLFVRLFFFLFCTFLFFFFFCTAILDFLNLHYTPFQPRSENFRVLYLPKTSKWALDNLKVVLYFNLKVSIFVSGTDFLALSSTSHKLMFEKLHLQSNNQTQS